MPHGERHAKRACSQNAHEHVSETGNSDLEGSGKFSEDWAPTLRVEGVCASVFQAVFSLSSFLSENPHAHAHRCQTHGGLRGHCHEMQAQNNMNKTGSQQKLDKGAANATDLRIPTVKRFKPGVQ